MLQPHWAVRVCEASLAFVKSKLFQGEMGFWGRILPWGKFWDELSHTKLTKPNQLVIPCQKVGKTESCCYTHTHTVSHWICSRVKIVNRARCYLTRGLHPKSCELSTPRKTHIISHSPATHRGFYNYSTEGQEADEIKLLDKSLAYAGTVSSPFAVAAARSSKLNPRIRCRKWSSAYSSSETPTNEPNQDRFCTGVCVCV